MEQEVKLVIVFNWWIALLAFASTVVVCLIVDFVVYIIKQERDREQREAEKQSEVW